MLNISSHHITFAILFLISILFIKIPSNYQIKNDNLSTIKLQNSDDVLHASFASLIQSTDSSSVEDAEEKKSDTFYYILGIIILITAAILFKQRYTQYLNDREQLDR